MADPGGQTMPAVPFVRGGSVQKLAGGQPVVVVETAKLLVTRRTRPVVPGWTIAARP